MINLCKKKYVIGFFLFTLVHSDNSPKFGLALSGGGANGFAHIATLKKEYEPLRGKSISVSAANKLKNVFERIPDAVLKKLKDADIPFLSSMALTKMILKGMPTKE